MLPGPISTDALIGASTTRREDDRLLRGAGRYIGDLAIHGAVEVAFVRSTEPHARIRGIDVSRAAAAPGVIAVIHAGDLVDVSPVPDFLEIQKPVRAFPLARDKVRHVGEPIVAVVATDRYLAEDAAEEVFVDLEPLPVVADIDAAIAPDAVLLYDEWGDNVVCDAVMGDAAATDELFARSRVVGETFEVQRHSPMPIENRGVVARWEDDRLTVWTSTQFPHMARGMLSAVLGLPEHRLRIVAPDIGGGFGGKAEVYAEEYLVVWLARHVGRPVRWLEDRYEHLVSACHARHVRLSVEGAFDDGGRLVGVRGTVVQDAGTAAVYPSGVATAFVAAAATHGAYRLEQMSLRVRSVVTNKTPTGAYRGFGAPEGVFAIERLLDKAARELGIDRIELRQRSLLRTSDLPYTSPTGARIDSGSHHEAFARAAQLGALAAAARETYGETETSRIGWGVVPYVQGTAATFFAATGHWTSQDSCAISFAPDGGVTVGVGIAAFGQGAVTNVATLAAGLLGVPVDDVHVVMGDTDRAPYGLGAWGSRGAVVAAGSIERAAGTLVAKGKRIAAHLLEAAESDLDVADGRFSVRGSPTRSVAWSDVATAALIRTLQLPPDTEPGLEAIATYQPPGLNDVPTPDGKMNAAATFNNQAHAAVVRVDTGTGHVELLRYIVVNDCGTVINPLLVAGQLHGGVAQGIGAALLEDQRYADGVPLATTFMDYLLPTALDVPPIDVEMIETPAPDMPLGIKGVGEAGIVGPPPVIAQAIDDALAGLGARPLTTTPIIAERVLDAIRAARLPVEVG